MGSYHCPSLEKLDVCGRFYSIWIALTLDPLLGHQVVLCQVAFSYYASALSHYALALNENINDKYLRSMGELTHKIGLIVGRTSQV